MSQTIKINNQNIACDDSHSLILDFRVFLISLLFAICLVMYYAYLPFQLWVLAQWAYILLDWQLTMSFWIILLTTVGIAFLELWAFLTLWLYIRYCDKTEIHLKKIARYWLVVYSAVLLILHYALHLDLQNYLIYLYGIIIVLPITILEAKTRFFIREKRDPNLDRFKIPKEKYRFIYFGFSDWLIIFTLIILILFISLNIFEFRARWDYFLFLLMEPTPFKIIWIVGLIIVVFWNVFEFLEAVCVWLAQQIIKDRFVIALRKLRNYAILFVALMLFTANLPLFALDKTTSTSLSLLITFIAYFITWRIRLR